MCLLNLFAEGNMFSVKFSRSVLTSVAPMAAFVSPMAIRKVKAASCLTNFVANKHYRMNFSSVNKDSFLKLQTLQNVYIAPAFYKYREKELDSSESNIVPRISNVYAQSHIKSIVPINNVLQLNYIVSLVSEYVFPNVGANVSPRWFSTRTHLCYQVESQKKFYTSDYLSGQLPPSTKPHDAYTPIQEGYLDLVELLDLKKTTCQVRKVVGCIIEQNILVPHVNITYAHLSNRDSTRKIRNDIPNLTWGRFTLDEDEVIKDNWKKLCSLCKIDDQEAFFEKVFSPDRYKTFAEKKQRNVIACYLGQGLQVVRHASNVYHHAADVLNPDLYPSTHRPYSPEDNKSILDEVKKSGDNKATWKRLSRRLNRTSLVHTWVWPHIRDRYRDNLKVTGHKRGKWTSDEDVILIEYLFKEKPLRIETIDSIQYSKLKNLRYELNRKPLSIHNRYRRIIQPTLKAYHLGLLNKNWRYDFLKYIVQQDVKYVKQIQWKEGLKLFPAQTTISLSHELRHFNQHDLSASIKPHLDTFMNRDDYTDDQKGYRSKIVSVYCNCAADE